ncbi:OLC1v1011609C1 [Oldenlandia corymbosa var. corymbosa]|uniref:rhamnogalacturonan endolyase n=1 Tax=Oldenlandia corymbosa var. corymbosa TaxID=529605 RepID=A0AAV1DU02_OLDCO|nr:OLC1v1011609C1 [Oldenlandia corymbosa var. corymbosa]
MMMEKTHKKKGGWHFLVLCLCFCIVSEFVDARGIAKNVTQKLGSNSPLTLEIQQQLVSMDNGLVKITLSIPGGMITEISYKGIPNLLDITQKESQRGYWDIVSTSSGQDEGLFHTIEGSSFQVIAHSVDKIELSFKSIYSPSSGNPLPLNIDKRFVMQSGQSGFYSYAIYERLEGWPALDIAETRIAFKLDQNLFHYMAIADDKQRFMPTAQDRIRGERLAYPEAIRVDNPSQKASTEQVDDKYQYSLNNKENQVHGWVSTDEKVGFWVIIPSYEFKTGGPMKQELTSHVGPTSLAVFHTRHYAGTTLKGLSFEDGEPWKKVFGPVFLYLNSGPNDVQPSSLWNNAKQQSIKEIQQWPYNFPMSVDFPHANQRATVSGRLQVNDRLLQNGNFPAKSAYVGLAAPGAPGSWQMDAKGYQFWTQTDEMGSFLIRHVRAGTYNLYAWVPGIFGDYRYEMNVMVSPGNEINLGNLVFNPPRNGPTIWEIGIPDRTAAEFYVPDPAPGLINPLYFNKPAEKYRQYGLWDRYTDLYPRQDLIFQIGSSDYQKDWFFAHVNRRTSENTYIPATWQISFDMKKVVPTATYTFRLALASATRANIQVRVNDPMRRIPDFSTTRIGTDNAIARHGIHGLYWAFNFGIPGNRLVSGNNSIFLRQSEGGYPFFGAMYDYLRLEGPVK